MRRAVVLVIAIALVGSVLGAVALGRARRAQTCARNNPTQTFTYTADVARVEFVFDRARCSPRLRSQVMLVGLFERNAATGARELTRAIESCPPRRQRCRLSLTLTHPNVERSNYSAHLAYFSTELTGLAAGVQETCVSAVAIATCDTDQVPPPIAPGPTPVPTPTPTPTPSAIPRFRLGAA